MPPSLTHLRRQIRDIPPEWLTRLEPDRHGKLRRVRLGRPTLVATVGEMVVEGQCRRREHEQTDEGED
jgi:hypothetical protein